MRGFCLEVSAPFACFTRPEMKVERVSYDVITPSAARGVFTAIFWKPAIRWRITKIEVLNPIKWTNIRRNEVSARASSKISEIFIEDKDKRQQRAALLLRDVRYRIHAQFDFISPEKRTKTINPSPKWLTDEEEKQLWTDAHNTNRSDEKEAKYAAMFDRRATKGQYFMHPYLGCREFSCDTIRLIKDLSNEPKPIDETRDLGFMLYDMDYSNPKDIKPMFFRAKMEKGVIIIPHPESEEVYK